MNKQECDVLNALMLEPYINQRILAELCGHSLGTVNRSVKSLIKDGYLSDDIRPTEKARNEIRDKAPKNAVILAAGTGMRMAPINTSAPKALLEVNGEPLIERTIRQLHEVGIREIYVVVGFMKEQFEYLIDEYGVELIVNPDYGTKNNLHSLKLAVEHISNTYIIPGDIWCDSNSFSARELYSWYMVSDLVDDDSSVRVNRRSELVTVNHSVGGNSMVGIAYLLQEQANEVRERVEALCSDSRFDNSFWEETLYERGKMIVCAKVIRAADVVEINTYEQLRELDSSSSQLNSDALNVISKVLGVDTKEITDIEVLKKGMTNRSFIFSCYGQRYIMRVPGEGTDMLIDRQKEAAVYRAISGKGLCDDPVYIDPANGYKITKYIENVRTCDPLDVTDIRRCMKRLRSFHEMELSVEHEFDIFGMIDFYESLWNGTPSIYRDHQQTKEKVLSLRGYIESHAGKKVLTHIDAVPDNFLFDGDVIQLTDWEYAGMQDPHVDIAMFCIYSMYNKRQVDRLISIYFDGNCPSETKVKIYCYIAACGLLWSNWCEYKRNLGVEFGEYSLRQYRYAKEYYKYAREEMKKLNEQG